MPDQPAKPRREASDPLGARQSNASSRGAVVWISLRPLLFVVLCAGGVFPASSARAHKVLVFATAEGKHIEGEVYFQGGGPAANVKVRILDADGQEIDEVTSDAEGRFLFKPRIRCNYKFVADAGLGHTAEYMIQESELPSDLAVDMSGDSSADNASGNTDEDNANLRHTVAHNGKDIAAETEALGRQVAALRKDLDKWKAELRFQDVLGGVGYIVGIMGLLFYFLGVRRKEKRLEVDP